MGMWLIGLFCVIAFTVSHWLMYRAGIDKGWFWGFAAGKQYAEAAHAAGARKWVEQSLERQSHQTSGR